MHEILICRDKTGCKCFFSVIAENLDFKNIFQEITSTLPQENGIKC